MAKCSFGVAEHLFAHLQDGKVAIKITGELVSSRALETSSLTSSHLKLGLYPPPGKSVQFACYQARLSDVLVYARVEFFKRSWWGKMPQ